MEEHYQDRLNAVLRKNAELNSQIGIDSTKAEIDFIHREQYYNLLFLKEIDPDKFERLTTDFKRYRTFNDGDRRGQTET